MHLTVNGPPSALLGARAWGGAHLGTEYCRALSCLACKCWRVSRRGAHGGMVGGAQGGARRWALNSSGCGPRARLEAWAGFPLETSFAREKLSQGTLPRGGQSHHGVRQANARRRHREHFVLWVHAEWHRERPHRQSCGTRCHLDCFRSHGRVALEHGRRTRRVALACIRIDSGSKSALGWCTRRIYSDSNDRPSKTVVARPPSDLREAHVNFASGGQIMHFVADGRVWLFRCAGR